MKNKKEFLGVLFSVLICVFLISVIVYATTSVGENISVGGNIAVNGAGYSTELSVIGTASVSQDFWASGSFQFAGGEGTATLSYSRLGTGTTGHSLADADDLLITGLLEVDDAAYFDSTVSVSSSLRVPTIYGNTDAGLYLRIGDAGTTGHSLDAEDDLMVTGELEVDGTAWFDGSLFTSFVSVNTTNTAATELSVLGTASISEDLWASGSFQFAGGEGTGSLSYSRLGAGTTGHSLADADDLLITGLLEVDDAAYFDSTVSVSSSLRVPTIYGNTDAGLYLRIGDAGTTGHSLAAEDDLLVTGKLEVDGTAYFDGVVSVSDANGIEIGGAVKFLGGTASPSADCTVGSWYFRATGVASSSLYFCATANEWDAVSIDR